MAVDYANALMDIKSEKDEKRLKIIELGVRKMLERELIEPQISTRLGVRRELSGISSHKT